MAQDTREFVCLFSCASKLYTKEVPEDAARENSVIQNEYTLIQVSVTVLRDYWTVYQSEQHCTVRPRHSTVSQLEVDLADFPMPLAL